MWISTECHCEFLFFFFTFTPWRKNPLILGSVGEAGSSRAGSGCLLKGRPTVVVHEAGGSVLCFFLCVCVCAVILL